MDQAVSINVVYMYLHVLPPHKSLDTSVLRLRVITSDLDTPRSSLPCARHSVVSVVFH